MTSAARPSRWVSLFIVLLLASAAAFVLGVTVERNDGHTDNTTNASTGDQAAQPHDEASEGAGSGEGDHGAEPRSDEPGTGGDHAQEIGDETLLGVNPESTAAVAGAVVASLLLASLAGLRPVPLFLLLGAAFCLTVALFDMREVAHQLDESRNGVAAVALLVTLLHLGASAAAVAAWRHTPAGHHAPPAAPGVG